VLLIIIGCAAPKWRSTFGIAQALPTRIMEQKLKASEEPPVAALSGRSHPKSSAQAGFIPAWARPPPWLM
jgi:hypothetical protein